MTVKDIWAKDSGLLHSTVNKFQNNIFKL